jgi:hypothetical protein
MVAAVSGQLTFLPEGGGSALARPSHALKAASGFLRKCSANNAGARPGRL